MDRGRSAGQIEEPVAVTFREAPAEREIDPVIVEDPRQRMRQVGGDGAEDRQAGGRRPAPPRAQDRGLTRLKRRMCQKAATPSFQPIFFPSA